MGTAIVANARAGGERVATEWRWPEARERLLGLLGAALEEGEAVALWWLDGAGERLDTVRLVRVAPGAARGVTATGDEAVVPLERVRRAQRLWE